jgi:hypothetical protein
VKIAIFDDYQNVAPRFADWSAVRRCAEITVSNDHVPDPSEVVERIAAVRRCACHARTHTASN